MKFVSEKPVDDDPDVGLVNPDEYTQPVDFQDEPVMRREVRMPTDRDLVNRRPPLPKFFRGPKEPDAYEGNRPPSPSDIALEGSDFAYTKADPGDGWIDYDDQGRVAHGDPQTVKLDTSAL